MKIENTFDIPLPPAEAWALLMDIRRIAPCMPGAELTEQVDERTYKGKVSVRLGPIALSFLGTVLFEQLDEAAKTAQVKARGADAKGRGSASATVAFGLLPSETGTTVNIKTDVDLTGSIAQYGRASGVLQSVANQLVGEFAENLRRSLEVQKTSASSAVPESTSAAPAPAAARPISGFGLLWRSLVATVKSWFGR